MANDIENHNNVFQKMELSSYKIYKFVKFSEIDLSSLIFFLYSRRQLSKFKKTKKEQSQKFLIFGKWDVLASTLRKFLYFRRELAKPENQKFVKFLVTFFVCRERTFQT